MKQKIIKELPPEQKPIEKPLPIVLPSAPACSKPNVGGSCPMCGGNGWYFVNEWIGSLQGRKDCNCNKN